MSHKQEKPAMEYLRPPSGEAEPKAAGGEATTGTGKACEICGEPAAVVRGRELPYCWHCRLFRVPAYHKALMAQREAQLLQDSLGSQKAGDGETATGSEPVDPASGLPEGATMDTRSVRAPRYLRNYLRWQAIWREVKQDYLDSLYISKTYKKWRSRYQESNKEVPCSYETFCRIVKVGATGTFDKEDSKKPNR
jgi:hypothetical protein